MPAVAVLKAGDQVPVIGVLFVDDVGSADGTVAPTHSGPTCAKVGVISGVITTSMVVVPAH